MKKIYKYRVIIFLIVVVGLMGMTRWNYRNYPWEKVEVETPLIPSPTTTSAPVIDADYPLWNLLPYKGKGFVVDRYIEPLTLVVAVRGIDKKMALKEVLKWLIENQVATESHKLVISN
ncbi:MAG: hypothetical protein AAB574_03585 [Patescibacteria group bacterium]|mgnify:FL=1